MKTILYFLGNAVYPVTKNYIPEDRNLHIMWSFNAVLKCRIETLLNSVLLCRNFCYSHLYCRFILSLVSIFACF